MRAGYRTHLSYLWLPFPELAVARVAQRVRHGGHNVPVDVIRRRYARGLTNFWHIYSDLVDFWRLYDGSDGAEHRIIAECKQDERPRVWMPIEYKAIAKDIDP